MKNSVHKLVREIDELELAIEAVMASERYSRDKFFGYVTQLSDTQKRALYRASLPSKFELLKLGYQVWISHAQRDQQPGDMWGSADPLNAVQKTQAPQALRPRGRRCI